MKFTINFVLLLFTLCTYAQDGEQRTQVFCLTPFSKNVYQVNGLAFGMGNSIRYLWDDEERPVKLNGVNIEINPIGTILLPFIDPSMHANDQVIEVNNGLYLAVGGFMGNVSQNGVSISLYNLTYENNGIGIAAVYNMSAHLRGIHISGIANEASISGSGLLLAPVNGAGEFKGLQVGLYNNVDDIRGLQIGIFNKSKGRGFQLGLWNSNGKRSFPFINW